MDGQRLHKLPLLLLRDRQPQQRRLVIWPGLQPLSACMLGPHCIAILQGLSDSFVVADLHHDLIGLPKKKPRGLSRAASF